MEQDERLKRRILRSAARPLPWCALAVVLLLGACTPGATLRGKVSDTSGEALPGVAVCVVGGGESVITNALGVYSLPAAPGKARIRFEKTGYAPGELEVDAPARGRVEVLETRLWNLPPSDGLFLFSGHRYTETDHTRPNQYSVENTGPMAGTPVTPKVAAPAPSGGGADGAAAVRLIAHRLPPHDARLARLRQANALLPGQMSAVPSTTADGSMPPPAYTERVWVADTGIPITTRSIDEPDRLLMEIIPAEPLSPGAYAVHWGAMDGLKSLEPRVFMFVVSDPGIPEEAPGAAPAPEGADEPEKKKDDAEKERRREEQRREMNRETDEGMG